jgi:hypothetical protein
VDEAYELRVHLRYGWERSSLRFFFSADNTLAVNPYVIAGEIVDDLYNLTDWLFYLSTLLTERSYTTHVVCKRLQPGPGGVFKAVFRPIGIQNRWVGPVADNFEAVPISWIADADPPRSGQTRLGPVGAGVINATSYASLWLAGSTFFINEHLTPRTTATGVPFRGVHIDENENVYPLIAGVVRWPPSRQANRRLRY